MLQVCRLLLRRIVDPKVEGSIPFGLAALVFGQQAFGFAGLSRACPNRRFLLHCHVDIALGRLQAVGYEGPRVCNATTSRAI